ncbi:hypothetical protein Gotur_024579 [Gossypium turneri]
MQTILRNFKLLFDEYVKNFKCTSSSLVGSFNVSDNDPVNSSLHQLNVNRADLGGEYDKSDDYNRYLSESNTKSEKKTSIRYHELSLLARYLLAIPISTVAFELAFSMGKKIINI